MKSGTPTLWEYVCIGIRKRKCWPNFPSPLNYLLVLAMKPFFMHFNHGYLKTTGFFGPNKNEETQRRNAAYRYTGKPWSQVSIWSEEKERNEVNDTIGGELVGKSKIWVMKRRNLFTLEKYSNPFKTWCLLCLSVYFKRSLSLSLTVSLPMSPTPIGTQLQHQAVRGSLLTY